MILLILDGKISLYLKIIKDINMTISIKTFFVSMTLAAALLMPVLLTVSTAYAVAKKNITPSTSICNDKASGGTGIAKTGTVGCGKVDQGNTAVTNLIKTVIDLASMIVGAVSVIMIIVGGLRYITSAGDSSKVSSAKSTILYAIVGLVIVVFAQTIVKYVINKLIA